MTHSLPVAALRLILRLTLLTALVFNTVQIASQERSLPTISVLNVEVQGVHAELIPIFVDTLNSHLASSDKVAVIDRLRQRSLLGEEGLDIIACISETCLAEIGARIGAGLIVVGSIGKAGSAVVVNLKVLDIDTGRTAARTVGEYESVDLLLAGCGDIANELIENAGLSRRQVSGIAFELAMLFPDSISVSAVYQVSNWFSVGVWGGWKDRYSLSYIPGNLEIVAGLRAEGGTKVVFGDKTRGFAIALIHSFPVFVDLIDTVLPDFIFEQRKRYELLLLPSGVGLYYKNFMLNIVPGIPTLGRGYWFIEIGYSFMPGNAAL